MSQGMKLLSFTAPNKEPVEKKDDIIGKKLSKKYISHISNLQ